MKSIILILLSTLFITSCGVNSPFGEPLHILVTQPGETGSPGIDGTDGQDGSDGDSGTDGLDGTSGVDGTNGSDGRSYYSYLEKGELREKAGDGSMELFIASDGSYYQLPAEFKIDINNRHKHCDVQDIELVFDTVDEQIIFTFQTVDNKRKMEYKSGPLKRLIDSSILNVYYKREAEVICSGVSYKVDSDVEFEIRVIEELED